MYSIHVHTYQPVAIFFNFRFGPSRKKLDPVLDEQDFEIQTHQDDRSPDVFRTVLKINRPGLSKAGDYMVKASNGQIMQTENFTLIVRSRPRVQISAEDQLPLFRVSRPFSK
jgi:hypothetical protein